VVEPDYSIGERETLYRVEESPKQIRAGIVKNKEGIVMGNKIFLRLCGVIGTIMLVFLYLPSAQAAGYPTKR